uniref:Conserved oligomeric Golgi complex subunit 8 n=1 Tax=Ditylenchus dipsaci TaxID=166011 RepID=A0A915E8K0_9BILA
MDEALKNRAAIEKDFQRLSLEELRIQRAGLGSRINHLQNEISTLAFNNYRTYADVGRTAENCKEMFSEMNHFMGQVKRDFPSLVDAMEKFRNNSDELCKESATLDDITSANCIVWELLKLPKMMEKCIRAGKYEFAFALTNFAVNLKQSKLIQNPMVKNVADILIEARHGLLDELFNKFSGPIDLAKSIQVVNNIRKIPYISNTQLRVSILQYRDVYLEKNVLGIMSEPDFVLRVIEVYRDCMYDTIVLYLAVFPGTDFQRKYTSMTDDPRWERWTGSSQTFLLQSWAHRNIERLFSFIRQAENKTALDIEAMTGKLMSFAFSFGRMGLDFRSLVVHEFSQIVVDSFKKKVDTAVKNLDSIKKLALIDSHIFENTMSDLEGGSAAADQDILSAPLELCVWDDLCVFGNHLIDALNEIRHSLSTIYLNQIFEILKCALQALFKWIDSFPTASASSMELVERASRLVLSQFLPFVNKCFFNCFPYEQCCRPIFRDTPLWRHIGKPITSCLLNLEIELQQQQQNETTVEEAVKFELIGREGEETEQEPDVTTTESKNEQLDSPNEDHDSNRTNDMEPEVDSEQIMDNLAEEPSNSTPEENECMRSTMTEAPEKTTKKD